MYFLIYQQILTNCCSHLYLFLCQTLALFERCTFPNSMFFIIFIISFSKSTNSFTKVGIFWFWSRSFPFLSYLVILRYYKAFHLICLINFSNFEIGCIIYFCSDGMGKFLLTNQSQRLWTFNKGNIKYNTFRLSWYNFKFENRALPTVQKTKRPNI